mmetsp:Transcript_26337/g.26581  ORF Transcript_26337/g.26581 Transcript_26337/m.26581 type:complete len:186 (+) Transcript_26337:337-894(+)
MTSHFYLIFSLILYFLHISSSEKWIVSFRTIYPRFEYCIHTISSWLNQTLKPSHILIFVTPSWNASNSKDSLSIPYQSFTSNNNHNLPLNSKNKEIQISHTEILRNILLQQFPTEFSSGLIYVMEIPADYGPATKFLGVLLAYPLFQADYWLIGDDDLIYSPSLLSRYSAFYSSSPLSLSLSLFR